MFDTTREFHADDTFDFDALVERAEAASHEHAPIRDDADAAELYELN